MVTAPPLTAGVLLAIILLILAIVMAAVGQLPWVMAGFFAGVSVAIIFR